MNWFTSPRIALMVAFNPAGVTASHAPAYRLRAPRMKDRTMERRRTAPKCASMVAIASRIVSEEGLAAVQARRVAQKQVARSALYNVFGGLDHLIVEANVTSMRWVTV
jgi:hypothetical protein